MPFESANELIERFKPQIMLTLCILITVVVALGINFGCYHLTKSTKNLDARYGNERSSSFYLCAQSKNNSRYSELIQENSSVKSNACFNPKTVSTLKVDMQDPEVESVPNVLTDNKSSANDDESPRSNNCTCDVLNLSDYCICDVVDESKIQSNKDSSVNIPIMIVEKLTRDVSTQTPIEIPIQIIERQTSDGNSSQNQIEIPVLNIKKHSTDFPAQNSSINFEQQIRDVFTHNPVQFQSLP